MARKSNPPTKAKAAKVSKISANRSPAKRSPKRDQKKWHQVLDADAISRAVSRLSYEILEHERGTKNLAIVGIRTGGEYLARRIHQRIKELEGVEVNFGIVDITLYRDDLSQHSAPVLKGTDIDFPISGARIVLIDDVLYTGRTIRAALDAIIDFGRPRLVELACLVDRGHRELPIRADYVGKNLPTSRDDSVKVRFEEAGEEEGVYLIKHDVTVKRG